MPIALVQKANYFLRLIGSPAEENCQGQEEFQIKVYIVLLFK